MKDRHHAFVEPIKTRPRIDSDLTPKGQFQNKALVQGLHGAGLHRETREGGISQLEVRKSPEDEEEDDSGKMGSELIQTALLRPHGKALNAVVTRETFDSFPTNDQKDISSKNPRSSVAGTSSSGPQKQFRQVKGTSCKQSRCASREAKCSVVSHVMAGKHEGVTLVSNELVSTNSIPADLTT